VVEVEAVAMEDSDEEVDTENVEGYTVRASRSGRKTKRPNLHIAEPAQPPQPKRAKAVVGRPVVAVAVDNGGPSALGLADEPAPVYDDADAMRSLKAIRERIAHLL
jgi:chemotaxis response regulator CheB